MARKIDDESADDSAANNRSIARMRERVNGAKAPIDDDDEDEDEEDDDEPEEAGNEIRADEDGESRRDRRRRRGSSYSRLQEENEALRRRQAEIDDALHQRRLQEARGGALPQSNRDPLEDQYDAILDEQERLIEEYNSISSSRKLSPEEEQKYKMRARDVKKRGEVVAAAIAQRRLAPSPEAQQEETYRRILSAEFQDVYGNKAQLEAAEGEYKKLCAKGAPKGLETARRALEQIRKEFSPRRRQTPPVEVRERFAAESRGSAGGLIRKEGGRTYVDMGDPGSPQRRMAHGLYPHLSEAEAEKKWARKMAARRSRES